MVAQETPNLLAGVRFPQAVPYNNKNGVIMKKFNLEEVKTFIANQSDETKIYLGADSERFEIDGVWYADYITAVVVHIDGRHGCKLFGEVCRERDYDQKKDKPAMRLIDRKSTRLNSSHTDISRMPSSA